MKNLLLIALVLILCPSIHAQDKGAHKKEGMNNYKKDVTLWYEAFNKKDPSLIDKILSETWVDIPAAPGQPTGPQGVKEALTGLTTTFPDFNVRIDEILQDGNKIIVRSEITGTQRGLFMGIVPKNRKIRIQAVDIHEFKDGKIVRTWHTEDWMTGFRQLGAFEK